MTDSSVISDIIIHIIYYTRMYTDIYIYIYDMRADLKTSKPRKAPNLRSGNMRLVTNLVQRNGSGGTLAGNPINSRGRAG